MTEILKGAVASLLIVLCVGLPGCGRWASKEKEAEAALQSIEVVPGFQVELVAMEPLVADPVDMEIDEYGRMYVVQMHGYPLDKSGSGKIRLLSDTDGDGRMDESTVFAEGLMLPTGIIRWKKGVLVTDAPHVLYLEDTDGDGVADIRDTVLTGFALSNPQHNVGTPVRRIDNWIYLGHEPAVTSKMYNEEFGDRGTEIFYLQRPDSPRLAENARGRSVRFRPDRFQLENLSSFTQFGHTFDNWGRYLLVHNANHIYHEVIANRYLERNPDLLVSDATQSVSDHGNTAEVFPITKNPEHQLLTDVGVFTSACGLTYYGGGLFPAPFDSVALVAEPVSNLVHADILRDKGASFTASRLYDDREFLASTDAWFRPVNMYVGPDGALYIIDYYRQIIEHPEWMADDVVKSGALYNGKDKGRIFRVTPTGTPAASWSNNLKLGDASTSELVEKLADRNSWWRLNAQRLLIDRNDKAAIPLLESMLDQPDAPLGRLHALWTLEGMHALTAAHIQKTLKDPVAGVRENAVKLAEIYLAAYPALSADLLLLKDDPDPKVRYQLLCTLGFIDSPQSAKAIREMLFKDVEDPWVQIAALSAASSEQTALLQSVLERFRPDAPAYASLAERLSSMVAAAGKPNTTKFWIRQSLKPVSKDKDGWQTPVLRGIAQGLRNGKTSYALLHEEQALLLYAALNGSPSVSRGSLEILKVTGLPPGESAEKALKDALRIAADTAKTPKQRTEAIEFLVFGKSDQYMDVLKQLITPAEPLPVQLAALRILGSVPDPTVGPYLLDKWPSLTTGLRSAAIGVFIPHEDRARLLIDAIENGRVEQSAIEWVSRVQLMAQSNEELRDRARALFAGKDDQQQAIIEQYNVSVDLKGDPVNGKRVFQTNCSLCHQIGGEGGIPYGPDLGTIRNRRAESIIADILNPNASIADGYDVWIFELNSGESMQGLIATETPAAITVRLPDGSQTTVSRRDIRSLKALGMSAMPGGLEKQINPQEMADLLAYIRERK